MIRRAKAPHAKVEGSGRVEAFSDGVIAIIVTLLIFEIHVPTLTDLSNEAVLSAFWALTPKLVSFAVSFLTVAIFWVNHHHFFSMVTHSDWKLLWANNLLLFWLSVVPFTTAFIGDYPFQPVVVSAYAFVLCMAALSFTLMGWHVFFHGSLIDDSISRAQRTSEWRRSWAGTIAYGAAAGLAFASVHVSLVILALLPIFYFVPNLLGREPE